MENKKKLLTPEELEQVAGGKVPLVVMIESCFFCQYCKKEFDLLSSKYEHEKFCPENPANKNNG